MPDMRELGRYRLQLVTHGQLEQEACGQAVAWIADRSASQQTSVSSK